jgi:hypothetical protein
MAMIFVLGIILGATSPLLRHKGKISLGVAAFGLAHPDVASGQAAVDSNRRFYVTVAGCELPAMVLALVSLAMRRAFWAGWAIHLAFALWVRRSSFG